MPSVKGAAHRKSDKLFYNALHMTVNEGVGTIKKLRKITEALADKAMAGDVAATGEVYVSAVVHDQVVRKIEATFVDLGEHTVKNIDKPIGFQSESESRHASDLHRTKEI